MLSTNGHVNANAQTCPGSEVKYPPNCATRLSLETNLVNANTDNQSLENVLEKLYEAKPNKKLFRIMTVIIYIFCVSMVAILLSLYYLFLWDPYLKYHKEQLKKQKEMTTLTTSTWPPQDDWLSESHLASSSSSTSGLAASTKAFFRPVIDNNGDKWHIKQLKRPHVKWLTKAKVKVKDNSKEEIEMEKVFWTSPKEELKTNMGKHLMEDPFTTYAKGNWNNYAS